MKYLRNSKGKRGFTMLELLMVVAVILIMFGIAMPVFKSLVRLTTTTHTVNGLRNIVNATALWAVDNSSKIPSPIYPGGIPAGQEPPPYYDAVPGGSEPGMWLDGVIYSLISVGRGGMTSGVPVTVPEFPSEQVEAGAHLLGTVFESRTSIKAMADDRNWYHHSYAMNANLEPDEISLLGGSTDPYLTEKDITKYNQPKAMIFIDCIETNVIRADEADLLIDTADRRHEGKYVIAAFLDGSVRKLAKPEIPVEDPDSDPEASQFWKGIDLKRY